YRTENQSNAFLTNLTKYCSPSVGSISQTLSSVSCNWLSKRIDSYQERSGRGDRHYRIHLSRIGEVVSRQSERVFFVLHQRRSSNKLPRQNRKAAAAYGHSYELCRMYSTRVLLRSQTIASN